MSTALGLQNKAHSVSDLCLAAKFSMTEAKYRVWAGYSYSVWATPILSYPPPDSLRNESQTAQSACLCGHLQLVLDSVLHDLVSIH